MTKNIGIDTVYIPRIEKLLNEDNTAFFEHTFTEAENSAAPETGRRAEYYAARFACKEAVFKAIAPLLKGSSFDLRKVESLHHEDGAPYIAIDDYLQKRMDEAGVTKLLVSVTTEQDYASAVVLAE